jgi:hypothetical protein
MDEPCRVCGDEAGGLCVICGQPVCDDHARMRDWDRACTDHVEEW